MTFAEAVKAWKNKTPVTYLGKDGKDLFDRYEEGLLSKDEVRGFYKGNIIKYVTCYQGKNGAEDLEKAKTYLERLDKFENVDTVYGTNGVKLTTARKEEEDATK